MLEEVSQPRQCRLNREESKRRTIRRTGREIILREKVPVRNNVNLGRIYGQEITPEIRDASEPGFQERLHGREALPGRDRLLKWV